jgi:hypothetical protein
MLGPLWTEMVEGVKSEVHRVSYVQSPQNTLNLTSAALGHSERSPCCSTLEQSSSRPDLILTSCLMLHQPLCLTTPALPDVNVLVTELTQD